MIALILALTAGAATALSASPPQAGAAAPSANIRIIAPSSGAKLQQSFVTVQYELVNAGVAAGSPNFSVQLDGRDPVVTTQTQQNFTGLGPGVHTVTVQLVDANNTPIAGSSAQVQFTIVAAQPQPAATPRAAVPRGEWSQPQLRTVAARPISAAEANAALPSSASALPLVSVIGFGALIGGIVSAMKTR